MDLSKTILVSFNLIDFSILWLFGRSINSFNSMVSSVWENSIIFTGCVSYTLSEIGLFIIS